MLYHNMKINFNVYISYFEKICSGTFNKKNYNYCGVLHMQKTMRSTI